MRRRPESLVFMAFDLLWCDGSDWRGRPLLERKARLRDQVPDDARLVRYVDHLAGDGASVLQAACGLDLEGVVGKYAAGVYQLRRCVYVLGQGQESGLLAGRRTVGAVRLAAG